MSGYILEAKTYTRNSCQMCHRRMAIDFHVPTEIWEAVMNRIYWGGPICLECFVREADEKLIEWDKEIRFFPISLITHLQAQGEWELVQKTK